MDKSPDRFGEAAWHATVKPAAALWTQEGERFGSDVETAMKWAVKLWNFNWRVNDSTDRSNIIFSYWIIWLVELFY